jgi:hypothetical protein
MCFDMQVFFIFLTVHMTRVLMIDIGEKNEKNLHVKTHASCNNYFIIMFLRKMSQVMKLLVQLYYYVTLDPTETPGTGTRVLGGLSYRESHFALELLHESNMITSLLCKSINGLTSTKSIDVIILLS